MYATISLTATEINTRMAGVYKYMSLAVLVSMLTSYLVGTTPELVNYLFSGITKWIVIFAPLAAVLAISWALNYRLSKNLAILLLILFAVVMGLSFSAIFITYSLGNIFSALMSAGILFITMSGYGYFTKNSLDSVGKYMFIGLISIIIASIVNIFIGSSIFTMVISSLAIIIFLGLTAYDSQRIREMIANDQHNVEIIGALTLYLNFINIFINLLQLFSEKKS